MVFATTRFGLVEAAPEDVIRFEYGVFGFEQHRDWVFVPDDRHAAVAWMQSVDRPDLAFAVVSPQRYVADYALKAPKCELEPLGLRDLSTAQVLAIMNNRDGALTLNLKAPIVVNLQERIGKQVIAGGDYSLEHVIQPAPPALMRAA